MIGRNDNFPLKLRIFLLNLILHFLNEFKYRYCNFKNFFPFGYPLLNKPLKREARFAQIDGRDIIA